MDGYNLLFDVFKIFAMSDKDVYGVEDVATCMILVNSVPVYARRLPFLCARLLPLF